MTGKLGLRAVLAMGLSALLTTSAAAQGGRGGGMGRGIGSLLINEGVHKELKLDEDQVAKARELAEKTSEKMREAFSNLQGLEGQDRIQKMQELNHELNVGAKKEASAFLKADQLARLTQIDYQNRGAAAFNDPEVQAKLKLTEAQKGAIKEIAAESQQVMRSIFTNSGGNREEAMAKLAELQKGVKDKVESKLTDDQKKAWKEMIGAPFEVQFQRRQRNSN